MKSILVSDAILTKLHQNFKFFSNASEINLKKIEFTKHSKIPFFAAAIEKKILNKNFNDFKKTKKTIEKKYYENIFQIKPKQFSLSEKENIGFLTVCSCIGWYSKSMNQAKEILKEEVLNNQISSDIAKIGEVVAIIIFMFRNNSSDDVVKKYILENYEINLSLCEKEKINVKDNLLNKVIASVCGVINTSKFEEAIEETFKKYKVDSTIFLTGVFAQAYFQKIPPYLIKRTFKIFPKHLKDLAGMLENSIYNN